MVLSWVNSFLSGHPNNQDKQDSVNMRKDTMTTGMMWVFILLSIVSGTLIGYTIMMWVNTTL
jgi:hypothetical protein